MGFSRKPVIQRPGKQTGFLASILSERIAAARAHGAVASCCYAVPAGTAHVCCRASSAGPFWAANAGHCGKIRCFAWRQPSADVGNSPLLLPAYCCSMRGLASAQQSVLKDPCYGSMLSALVSQQLVTHECVWQLVERSRTTGHSHSPQHIRCQHGIRIQEQLSRRSNRLNT
jgi:hypothetical protein